MYIDQLVASIDLNDHTPANARRVHDALMLLLCFREHPITRPSCIRLLRVPGAPLELCSECTDSSCPGNGWEGDTIVMRHYKTAGAYGSFTINVRAGSKTAVFKEQYLTWARPLLLEEETNVFFLSTRGKAFRNANSFNKYMPRLLQGVAKLGWTKVSVSECSACNTAQNSHHAHTHASPSCATSLPTGWCHWQRRTSWRAWLLACKLGEWGYVGLCAMCRTAHTPQLSPQF